MRISRTTTSWGGVHTSSGWQSSVTAARTAPEPAAFAYRKARSTRCPEAMAQTIAPRKLSRAPTVLTGLKTPEPIPPRVQGALQPKSSKN